MQLAFNQNKAHLQTDSKGASVPPSTPPLPSTPDHASTGKEPGRQAPGCFRDGEERRTAGRRRRGGCVGGADGNVEGRNGQHPSDANKQMDGGTLAHPQQTRELKKSRLLRSERQTQRGQTGGAQGLWGGGLGSDLDLGCCRGGEALWSTVEHYGGARGS